MSAGRRRPPLKFDALIVPQEATVVEPQTPGNLDNVTTIKFGEETLEISPSNLDILSHLGKGAYGVVEKVKHIPSGSIMALKRISVINQETRKQLMDMDVLNKADGCPNIVKFYGALFSEGDLWIFMEIMDASLDKFYKMIYPKKGEVVTPGDTRFIPENVLGFIAASIVTALYHLYSIKIIHRDIKPSNILINKEGKVKLCDFGIAGYLVNSLAKTFEAGCKPYMAPERIDPRKQGRQGYDIRSDVWSLGITMSELSIGKFPYPEVPGNFFLQIKQVCEDEPPRLPEDTDRFSPEYRNFIVQCLQKEYDKRPNYSTLMQHPIIVKYKDEDISAYAAKVLNSEST